MLKHIAGTRPNKAVNITDGYIEPCKPKLPSLPDLVRTVGHKIGYTPDNHIDAERYRIHDEICYTVGDPRHWNETVNDQSILVGWAGYDAQTHYLPPEQFLVHRFRNAPIESCRHGALQTQGPDGKLLVRLHEETLLRGRGGALD